MKTCTWCGIEKPLDRFALRFKNTDTRLANCKDCQNVASRKHYVSNKKAYIDRNNRRRDQWRSMIIEAKEKSPCGDCGRNGPYYTMDFDHRPDEVKLFNISKLSSIYSTKSLIAEMAKCDIVCAYCHRVRTWVRLQPEEQDELV